MGQYTICNIQISFTDSEKADDFLDIIEDFESYLIKKYNNNNIHVNITHYDSFVDNHLIIVYITLDSGRILNAEWQCYEIEYLIKEQFLKYVTEFNADIQSPTNFIYWNKETLD